MAGAMDELERGRGAYDRRAWGEARVALTAADRSAGLGADDLELLASVAFMLGRDDEFVALLERAHHSHLADGATRRAVRCAFWLGMNLFVRGEVGRATGWLGRAQRLLANEPECAQQGYLLPARPARSDRGGPSGGATRRAHGHPRPVTARRSAAKVGS
jgi:Flp pilus assembly protein TadD